MAQTKRTVRCSVHTYLNKHSLLSSSFSLSMCGPSLSRLPHKVEVPNFSFHFLSLYARQLSLDRLAPPYNSFTLGGVLCCGTIIFITNLYNDCNLYLRNLQSAMVFLIM